MQRSREPIFNIPAVVLLTIAAMVLVHVVRQYGLTSQQDRTFLLEFAFFPARYDPSVLKEVGGIWPGGVGAQVWSFVTYAFIHGDWTHLGLNAIWFLAFGSAVARRFGAIRFIAFFTVTAAAGAALHLATNAGDFWPMVGASASVSGCMAAAVRFVFQAGGPLAMMRAANDNDYRMPAKRLLEVLREPRVLMFLAVWFGLNLIFGISSFSMVGEGQSIAWQAHIGGFLAGLLLFSLFDPVPRRNIIQAKEH
ncbi:rhomboid family protein [Variibacter gotjawalensis]|uniref:Rhomboid family protein n=1 Tax=Variibacter gotjawalensis TaxID=1333996 RepID=A0A0S3PWJ6_9BRAD|nr:rhomboid family intramembrane serine protease [Variibacter gotjawalensis]NIK45986.1 membrane associated rhomboid family serine protease [Variibacter gotjawalensis]RZS47904.1 membrane associated rhomboid family serine protease [Variibacter gotjawalensis]BAT60160.1 rhomboid family protein [Variibacter gotjawalensis]